MWNNKKSVKLSLVVCCVVAVVILITCCLAPMLLKMYFTNYKQLASPSEYESIIKTILWCLYPCAVLGELALYWLIRMLQNIKREQIFFIDNVKYLRGISWCCFAVAVITLIGAISYLPFMLVTIAAGFIGLILRVVKNVMQSAVELREDHDLTI